MKKFLPALIVVALVGAAFFTQRLRLFRLRMYASGIAWSENACSTKADCEAVIYRENCGWVTAKKNHGLGNLAAAGRDINALELELGAAAKCEPLIAQCTNSICMAGP